jgi:hypothetical protein
VGLAVLATPSDYSSTRVSLVSSAGALTREDCIDSGTNLGPGSSLTLSGDVTLPSQPQRGSDLWVVDRGNAALLVLDPATCAVRRQMSVSTGFRANPHDVVVVSDSLAYVPRFEKNLAPANPMAAGDDVLMMNPTTGDLLGRIDLSSYAAPVAGATIQARPDRAVIAAGKLFVTLGSQDASFSSTGEGRVVVIDPATSQVTASIAISGLEGCSAMAVLPSGQTLYVACAGAFGADQALHSGVALVDLTANPPVVSRVVGAQLLGGQPINFSWVSVLAPTKVFTGTLGNFDPVVPDAVFAFDPTNGQAVQAGMAAAYDLGRSTAGGTHLYVADGTATAPRIRILDVSGGATVAPPETGSVAFDPAKRLLPREVAWY